MKAATFSKSVASLMLLLVLTPGFGAAQEGGPATSPPPELPAPVWDALLDTGAGTVIVRADYQQLRSLPELSRIAAEHWAPSSMHSAMFRGLAEMLSAFEPASESVSELWATDGFVPLLARTDLGREELISAYVDHGWVPIYDEGAGDSGRDFLRQPVEEETLRKLLEGALNDRDEEARRIAELRAAAAAGDESAKETLGYMASGEPESERSIEEIEREIRTEQEQRTWKMVAGENGWLALFSPWSQPVDISMKTPSQEEMAEVGEFPFGPFLEKEPEDVLLIAMVFDGGEEEESAPDLEGAEEKDPRRERLQRELEELIRERGTLVGGGTDTLKRIGNMLLRINEIDGGIDFDLRAEIPGDPRESFTADVIQIGLSFLRMSVVSLSPELARELLDTSVSVSHGQLHATANVSHASLLDFVQRSIDRGRRLTEIQERMTEIQQELSALLESEE